MKIENFLSVRGLKINSEKSKVLKINKSETFDYLGFTFKLIIRPKITRVTKKVNDLGQIIKSQIGFFVYVSSNSIRKFKDKINNELKLLSKSVFQIIIKLNIVVKRWINYFGISSYETLVKIERYLFKKYFKFVHKKFSQMSKKNIATNFFLRKIGNVNWNFNAPFFIKSTKETHRFYVIFIRICSIVKFISVLKLRPYNRELINSFIDFSVNGAWAERISKARYKMNNFSNIIIVLIKWQLKICYICQYYLGSLKNVNFKKHYLKQQKLFFKLKNEHICENRQLIHKNYYKVYFYVEKVNCVYDLYLYQVEI